MSRNFFNKYFFFYFFVLSIVCAGCTGCGNAEECVGETLGDFIIFPNQILLQGSCTSMDLPSGTTWADRNTFTSNHNNKSLWFLKIRIDGFCDNIGKTEPFTIIREGVDGTDIETQIVNGLRAIRVNNVPIDRQLSISLEIFEPCHGPRCPECPEIQTEFRTQFTGVNTVDNVEHLGDFPITIIPDLTVDCNCP